MRPNMHASKASELRKAFDLDASKKNEFEKEYASVRPSDLDAFLSQKGVSAQWCRLHFPGARKIHSAQPKAKHASYLDEAKSHVVEKILRAMHKAYDESKKNQTLKRIDAWKAGYGEARTMLAHSNNVTARGIIEIMDTAIDASPRKSKELAMAEELPEVMKTLISQV